MEKFKFDVISKTLTITAKFTEAMRSAAFFAPLMTFPALRVCRGKNGPTYSIGSMDLALPPEHCLIGVVNFSTNPLRQKVKNVPFGKPKMLMESLFALRLPPMMKKCGNTMRKGLRWYRNFKKSTRRTVFRPKRLGKMRGARLSIGCGKNIIAAIIPVKQSF